VKEVEEVRREGELAAPSFHVELASEAAHGALAGERPAAGVHRDRLAVEDEDVSATRSDVRTSC